MSGDLKAPGFPLDKVIARRALILAISDLPTLPRFLGEVETLSKGAASTIYGSGSNSAL